MWKIALSAQHSEPVAVSRERLQAEAELGLEIGPAPWPNQALFITLIPKRRYPRAPGRPWAAFALPGAAVLTNLQQAATDWCPFSGLAARVKLVSCLRVRMRWRRRKHFRQPVGPLVCSRELNTRSEPQATRATSMTDTSLAS